MKNPRDNDFASRRNEAAASKAALLKAHRVTKDAADLTRKEREAVSAARTERHAERAREKLDEQNEAQAAADVEKLAADAAAKAEVEAQEDLELDRVARATQDDADKKAERDQRYANRKARQR
jgi:hypothetical protein